MNSELLSELLEGVPLEIRAEVREFAAMSPAAQRLHLYVTVREIKRPTHLKTHVVQAVYTTAIALGVFAQRVI